MIIVKIKNKRERILLSSLALLHKKGFKDTSINMIATHGEIAVGTIYHYFSSKDEIIVELWNYCTTKLVKELSSAPLYSTFEALFYSLFSKLVDFYTSNREIYSFSRQFFASPYYTIYQKSEIDNEQTDPIKDLFEKGKEEKRLKKMTFESFICFVLGAIYSYIKMSIADCNQYMKAKNLQDLLHILWDGVKANNELSF